MTEQNNSRDETESIVETLRKQNIFNQDVDTTGHTTLIFVRRDNPPATEFLKEGETVTGIVSSDDGYTVCTGEATGSVAYDATTIVSHHDNADDAIAAVVAQFAE
jgi:hypothetical protein